ncbi:AAA family ATPase [Streptomyces sp. INA 01156]
MEEYGLEPSAGLQTLQRRILRHDQALASPAGGRAEPGGTEVCAPRRHTVAESGRVEVPARITAADTAAPGTGVADVAELETVPAPEFARAEEEPRAPRPLGVAEAGAVAERRDVCVLVVCTESAADAAAMESEQLDTSLHDAFTVLTESVEARSGTVVGSMGGLCAALFGLRSERPEASLNAVRAAFAARERLTSGAGMVMRAVVISGKAIVRHDPHDPRAAVSVVGTLLDKAHGLLSGVPAGELYVSEEVAGDTDAWVRYGETTHAADGVAGIRRAQALRAGVPMVRGTDTQRQRRHELALLENFLEYSRHHDVPSMLTVLGDREVGKTRLLAQFERRIARDFEEVRVVRPRALKGGPEAAGMAAALLEAWAPRDRAALDTPKYRLRSVVRAAVDSDVDAVRLLRVLSSAPDSGRPGRWTDVLAAWGEVIEHEARHRPLVLCLDDLHLADEEVLDWVESLGRDTTGSPLLVVACGHSDLLRRRPFWGSGRQYAGMLTLPRLWEPAPMPRRMVPFPECRPKWPGEQSRTTGRSHGGFRGRAADPVEARPGRRAV